MHVIAQPSPALPTAASIFPSSHDAIEAKVFHDVIPRWMVGSIWEDWICALHSTCLNLKPLTKAIQQRFPRCIHCIFHICLGIAGYIAHRWERSNGNQSIAQSTCCLSVRIAIARRCRQHVGNFHRLAMPSQVQTPSQLWFDDAMYLYQSTVAWLMRNDIWKNLNIVTV